MGLRVCAVDTGAEKRDLCLKLGAERWVDFKESKDIVADIKAEADDRVLFPESHYGMVPHTHGISEARLRVTFEGAGLGAFAMKDAARVDMKHWGQEGKEMTWFIARGAKPE